MGTATINIAEGYLCGVNRSFSGTAGFPVVNQVSVGPNPGEIVFRVNAGPLPDKFIVKDPSGNIILDTGYLGSPSKYQTTLNTALASKGLSPETIIDSDGIQNGNYTFNFTKGAGITIYTVEVYAPFETTGWTFKMECPFMDNIYYNTSQSITYNKNNCPSGQTGSIVVATINPHVTYSFNSQSEANANALALLTSGRGQTYANDFGHCA